MTDAAKEARRAYKREWNRRNPEKNREYQRNYWERRALIAAQEQAARQAMEERPAARKGIKSIKS